MKAKIIIFILFILFITIYIIFSTSSLGWKLKPSRNLKTEVVNGYDFDFKQHYQDVLQKIKAEDDALLPFVVYKFNLVLSSDGTIETLEYYFYFRKNDKYYRSYIEYKNRQNKLTIKTQKINIWKYDYMMVGAKDFFDTLDSIGLNKLAELLSTHHSNNFQLEYHGTYTFDEEDGKKKIAYNFENNELIRTFGSPPIYRPTLSINNIDSKGNPMEDVIWILFKGFSRSKFNNQT